MLHSIKYMSFNYKGDKMTTLYDSTVKCPNCGTLTTVYAIGSTNAFGPGDLDTRPPEMARSNILYGVESCTKCGLSAGSLGSVDDTRLKFFRSGDFKEKHDSVHFEGLAENYWTAFLLALNAGALDEAIYHILRAAWASDDRGMDEAAKKAREIMLDTLKEHGKEPSYLIQDEPLAGYLMSADIHRRAGRFEESIRLARHVAENDDDFIGSLALLEIELCEKKETGCYMVDGERRLH